MEDDRYEPADIYVLRMGSNVEVHTAESVLERVRGLMYHGRVAPGYSVERWYWIGAWCRADDEWGADDE